LKRAALFTFGVFAVSSAAQAADTPDTLMQHLRDRAMLRAMTRAQQNPTPATAPVTVSGTLTITAKLSFESLFASASKSPVTCGATVDLYDQALDTTTESFIGYDNSAIVSGTLARSATSGTCTITVPYRFTYTHASSKISISFVASGTTEAENFYSATYETEIAIPANNAKTPVAITASM
jgi:hypothetical protein